MIKPAGQVASKIKLYQHDHLIYLQSSLLTECRYLKHAFSTRVGGHSSGVFSTLNTAFHTGDNAQKIAANRKNFFDLFRIDNAKTVAVIQVHGTSIIEVDHLNRGEGAFPFSVIQEADALLTSEQDLPITAYAADCLLIYLASRQTKLVALTHAGWRGTLGGIGEKVVRYLKKEYNQDPADLVAAFSPSICKKCYTIDQHVARQFKAAGWGDISYLELANESSWNLDLAAINRQQLLQAGLTEHNIDIGGWCTSCRDDLFYSYRRDQGQTGRMIGFLSIDADG